MNWKIAVGVLLLAGALREMTSIVLDYRSGKLGVWPFGADIGCAMIVALGIYLIRKGRNEKRVLKSK